VPLLLCLLPVFSAPAQEAEFSPRVVAGMSHDSNPLRLGGAEEVRAASGETEMEDLVLRYGAGIRAAVPLSRQYFVLDAEAVRNRYDRFDFLDHTASDVRGRWAWRYGDLWDGNLRLRHRRDISPLEELRPPVRDRRLFREAQLEARRRLTPRWSLEMTAGRSGFEHELEARRGLNRDFDLLRAGFVRRAADPDALVLGWRVQARRAGYPDRPPGAVDNDHMDYEAGGELQGGLSPRSAVDVRVAYAALRHEEMTRRDFSGAVGRAAYRYRPSERSTLEISLWRELDRHAEAASSYVTEDGFRLRSAWRYSDAFTLEADFSYRDRRFDGELADGAQDGAGLSRRHDRLRGAGLSAVYRRSALLTVTIAYRVESRRSNHEDRPYRYRLFTAEVQLSF
jgi:hypothetical protein